MTYNPKIDILNLLIDSIKDSVKTVAIVDNGSTNVSTIKTLSNTYTNLIVIDIFENKGIGFAQNRGIEYLLADDEIKGVILFDHDSHPMPDMISILNYECERLLTQGVKVAAVGPVYIDPRTKNFYPISVFSGFRLKKKYPTEDGGPIIASFLIASGSLTPRSTFEATGLMNEDFFIDYIDIEWSFRATDKGFTCFACPAARMYHQVGDGRLKVFGREISIHSPLRRYYLARNSIFMLNTKYIDWKYKVRELFYTIMRVFIFLLFVKKRMTYIRYITRGWYDGLKGRGGRYDD